MAIGVIFEHLIWLKRLSFTEQRLKVVEERLRKDIESVKEITAKALDSGPKTSGHK